MPVATDLPPVKRKKIDLLWPRMAITPISTAAQSLMPSQMASETGSAPLATSSRKTAIAAPLPAAR
ncbi:hypothetical protein D3C78_1937550 [compost metagenome]